MHDDQWGAATVTLAALINALKIIGVEKMNAKIVLSGVGAAGVATGRLLHEYGITNTLFCDSHGIINSKREDLNKEKIELLNGSKIEEVEGKLEDAIKNANVFIGLSKPNVLTADMIRTMAPKPIIFALANPSPEIMPDIAISAGAYVVATGRSDFPNQINNSLVFPGAFKAMLDKQIPQFENKIFIKVAEALANMVEAPTPEKIIPSMFDTGVKDTVYNAVSSLK